MTRRLYGLAGQLEDLLGRSMALRLIGSGWHCDPVTLRWHGALYVPKVLRPGHHLEMLLGCDAARRLVDAFAGEVLQPPRCKELHRDLLARDVRDFRARGMTLNEIATLVGASVRTVQRALERM